jgi:alcohol dehydrogenase class IV
MVVIDPTLALEVPFSVTAASGLDALTQLLEAYVSVKANPFIDSLALPAIGVAGKSLLSLLQGNLDDLSARTDMAYAAYISGIAIANAGLGYVHGFAGPLGALHPVPHGVVCGKLLAPLNRALVSRAMETEPNNILLEKYGKIATLWQVDGPLGVVSHLEHLTNLADLPNLRTYGFTEYELSALGKKDAARNSPVRLAEETTVEVLGQLF